MKAIPNSLLAFVAGIAVILGLVAFFNPALFGVSGNFSSDELEERYLNEFDSFRDDRDLELSPDIEMELETASNGRVRAVLSFEVTNHGIKDAKGTYFEFLLDKDNLEKVYLDTSTSPIDIQAGETKVVRIVRFFDNSNALLTVCVNHDKEDKRDENNCIFEFDMTTQLSEFYETYDDFSEKELDYNLDLSTNVAAGEHPICKNNGWLYEEETCYWDLKGFMNIDSINMCIWGYHSECTEEDCGKGGCTTVNDAKCTVGDNTWPEGTYAAVGLCSEACDQKEYAFSTGIWRSGDKEVTYELCYWEYLGYHLQNSKDGTYHKCLWRQMGACNELDCSGTSDGEVGCIE
jgi:hypothetical protein